MEENGQHSIFVRLKFNFFVFLQNVYSVKTAVFFYRYLFGFMYRASARMGRVEKWLKFYHSNNQIIEKIQLPTRNGFKTTE